MSFSSFSSPFIRRPVATTLLTIGVLLSGAVAFTLLPVAPLPQVDVPVISVNANLPGASPETMAASVALPLELQVSPTLYTDDRGTQVGISVLQVVNTRANLLGATRMLDDIALDKYSFVRDGYLQRRRSLVYDGEPPEVRDEEDDAAEPASGSASAPAK